MSSSHESGRFTCPGCFSVIEWLGNKVQLHTETCKEYKKAMAKQDEVHAKINKARAIMSHRDCAGRVLKVGDRVATNNGVYLSKLDICVILGFTEKMVKLRSENPVGYNSTPTEFRKLPAQLCIIR